jgi:hypothetical protein
MRRKAVHIAAAIAESLRFFAIAFLAFDVGSPLNAGISSLLRYAAAPQLLFAAGFFFLWLDPPRYGAYRPLLLVGKAASAVCFIPLAASLLRDPRSLALGWAFLIGAADIFSLSVLIIARTGLSRPPVAPAAGQGPSRPGQSPEEIERVEGF